MIILIDAYNMLKQIIAHREIGQTERMRFLSQVGRYSTEKKHYMVVVFDGGPYEWLHKERVHGVQAVYSGLHESADDYIKHYIREHQASDVLLVTDDRELNNFAARFSMPSISPRDFYSLIQEALQSPELSRMKTDAAATKITDESSSEIDLLMQEASRMTPIKNKDEQDSAQVRFADGKKLSKEERKLLKKLKKL